MNNEPTVQVPVSLPTREQIESAVDSAIGKWWDDGALLATLRPALLDAVLALLSQPTPTAELPMCGAISAFTGDSCVEYAGHSGRHISIRGLSWEADRRLAPRPDIAEPPRIEDMAPGTTFWATDRGSGRTRYWMRLYEGVQVWWHPHWEAANQDDIDPSTIRDVIPPKDAA